MVRNLLARLSDRLHGVLGHYCGSGSTEVRIMEMLMVSIVWFFVGYWYGKNNRW